MRQFISKYGAYLAGAAIVLAAVIMFATRSRPISTPTRAFYIDEVTGEESYQPADSIPPLPGKDGKPTLVHVVKISCDKGKTSTVAYYRKYSLPAKQKIQELLTDPNRVEEAEFIKSNNEFVRLPAAGSPWVNAMSEEGEKILNAVQCPPGQVRQAVYP